MSKVKKEHLNDEFSSSDRRNAAGAFGPQSLCLLLCFIFCCVALKGSFLPFTDNRTNCGSFTARSAGGTRCCASRRGLREITDLKSQQCVSAATLPRNLKRLRRGQRSAAPTDLQHVNVLSAADSDTCVCTERTEPCLEIQ